MRAIKFRGKRPYNGEWVYGHLMNWNGRRPSIIVQRGDADQETGEAYCDDFIVYPETVGQYTGIEDKNGTEIYEGDICNCRAYECFGKVEWNNEEAGFYFCVVMEGGGFEEEHLYDYVDELEVIGNIHDNPELVVADNA